MGAKSGPICRIIKQEITESNILGKKRLGKTRVDTYLTGSKVVPFVKHRQLVKDYTKVISWQ